MSCIELHQRALPSRSMYFETYTHKIIGAYANYKTNWTSFVENKRFKEIILVFSGENVENASDNLFLVFRELLSRSTDSAYSVHFP